MPSYMQRFASVQPAPSSSRANSTGQAERCSPEVGRLRFGIRSPRPASAYRSPPMDLLSPVAWIAVLLAAAAGFAVGRATAANARQLRELESELDDEQKAHLRTR